MLKHWPVCHGFNYKPAFKELDEIAVSEVLCVY